MGWFNKKEKEKKEEVPSLPELPKLPTFPDIKSEDQEELLPKLPTFPNNSLGQEFSQNTIKDAIKGKKGDAPFPSTNNFLEEKEEPLKKPLTKEGSFSEQIHHEIPKEPTYEQTSKQLATEEIPKRIEPLFIRIDKFEESSKIFEKLKKQTIEIEKMLKDIKELKTEEEKELILWENKIQTTKQQIEKVDQDIFSKIK